MPDQLVDDLTDVRRDNKFVMVGAESLRGYPRVLQFVVAVFMKTDRESLDRTRRMTRHQANHSARINSAGEKRAERNFRLPTYAHRFVQQGAQFLEALVFALRRIFLGVLVRKIPVLLDTQATVCECQEMAGRP